MSWWAVFAAILFSASALRSQEPGFPPSPVIAGLSLDWSTHQRHALGSDNWQLAWANDDHQYGAWGDGAGFGEGDQGRVGLGYGRIEGDWTDHRGYNVWGGRNPENPAQFAGKSWGTISVAGVLYSWVVPDNPDTGGPRDHYRYIELARSEDRGAHWTRANWRWWREDDLVIPTFVVQGKDQELAKDGYIYSYFIRPQNTNVTQSAFGLSVQQPGALFLARAPKARLFEGRDVYEWFTGLQQGKPGWGLLTDKKPVLENPDGTGWCVSAIYNPGLNRYLLATEHSVSHAGAMVLFDAPDPWGPWTMVKRWSRDEPFGHQRSGSTLDWANNVFFLSFSPKWFSNDGVQFTLIFTGGGNGKNNDSFNSVRGRFQLRPLPQKSMTNSGTNAEAIRLHPENPHYFLWRGNPTILVTAGEHYGAVVNLDFDYVRYLETLKSHKFNLTRIFSGAYREVPGSFNIRGNTLAPAPARFVCPWARSQTPGATDGGNKFDLTQWDETYFSRIKDFVRAAGQLGVVVEMVLFCTMYDDSVWDASPMNIRNNINNVGSVGKYEVHSGDNRDLLQAQKAVTRKLVTELNEFDNVYFEVCNEPYERGGLTKAWNDQIVSTIVEAESELPIKHLIARGFPSSASSPVSDLNPHISVLNFHAAARASARLNRHHNRVLAFDETGGADRSDRKYRSEGWAWLMSGGGVYDHLDFSFTTDRPDGSAVPLPPGTPGGGGPKLRRQLQVLKEFVEELNFLRLAPSDALVEEFRITGATTASSGSAKPAVHAMAEVGKTYAIYVHGGTHVELVMDLPVGCYEAKWINTKNGRIEMKQLFGHTGGKKTLSSPTYSEDIALRVTRAREE